VKVRSLELDRWKRSEILMMELGGNAHAKNYLKSLGKETFEGYKNDFSKKYGTALTKKVRFF
jgi:hypothetical protein